MKDLFEIEYKEIVDSSDIQVHSHKFFSSSVEDALLFAFSFNTFPVISLRLFRLEYGCRVHLVDLVFRPDDQPTDEEYFEFVAGIYGN